MHALVLIAAVVLVLLGAFVAAPSAYNPFNKRWKERKALEQREDGTQQG